MPVVGPGFNFPTANSVADDFSLPQLTNALRQGIGGVGHRRQLDRAELRSQQRTDHLYHRHGIVASSRDRTVRLDGFSTWTNYWPGSPWHSFCLYRPDVACEATPNPNSRPNVSGPQLAASLNDPAGLLEEANMRLTASITIVILSAAPTSADSI